MVCLMALALPLLLDGPRVTATPGSGVDADAVSRGVEARIGESGDAWTVEISGRGGEVVFRGAAPGRAPVEQALEVPEGEPEQRAIMVASAVAFALEASTPLDRAPPESTVGAVVGPVRPWWADVGAAVAFNARGELGVAGGLELGGGRWLDARQHVRLGLALGWTHARRDQLAVHAFEPRLEVGAGAWVGEHIWLGGGLGLGVTGAWALDRERASAVAVRVRVPALVEVPFGERWFVRGAVGIDVRGTGLRFIGASGALRWRPVRPFTGLSVGVSLP